MNELEVAKTLSSLKDDKSSKKRAHNHPDCEGCKEISLISSVEAVLLKTCAPHTRRKGSVFASCVMDCEAEDWTDIITSRHEHSLQLLKDGLEFQCVGCSSIFNGSNVRYSCEPCSFNICLDCVRKGQDQFAPDTATKPYRCQWPGCGFNCTFREEIKAHMESHNERPFVCEVDGCNKSFGWEGSLQYHRWRHDETQHLIWCEEPGCARPFTNKELCEDHMRLHAGSEVNGSSRRPLLSCQVDGCKKLFYRTTSLEAHIKAEHDPNKPPPLKKRRVKVNEKSKSGRLHCQEGDCKRAFGSKDVLKKHLENVHHVERGVYKCEVKECGKEFVEKDRLETHHKTIHTGKKEFECNDCDKSFFEKSSLTRHIRTHDGKKPFGCDFGGCDKRFSDKSSKTIHERTHTGDRPFQCDECDKTFRSKKVLNGHVRLHTGDKPFKCNYSGCNRAFAHKYSLSVHSRVHTGEKPFKCSFDGCGKSFADGSSCRVHERIHTGEKPFKCQRVGCEKAFPTKARMRKHMQTHDRKRNTTIILGEARPYIPPPVINVNGSLIKGVSNPTHFPTPPELANAHTQFSTLSQPQFSNSNPSQFSNTGAFSAGTSNGNESTLTIPTLPPMPMPTVGCVSDANVVINDSSSLSNLPNSNINNNNSTSNNNNNSFDQFQGSVSSVDISTPTFSLDEDLSTDITEPCSAADCTICSTTTDTTTLSNDSDLFDDIMTSQASSTTMIKVSSVNSMTELKNSSTTNVISTQSQQPQQKQQPQKQYQQQQQQYQQQQQQQYRQQQQQISISNQPISRLQPVASQPQSQQQYYPIASQQQQMLQMSQMQQQRIPVPANLVRSPILMPQNAQVQAPQVMLVQVMTPQGPAMMPMAATNMVPVNTMPYPQNAQILQPYPYQQAQRPVQPQIQSNIPKPKAQTSLPTN